MPPRRTQAERREQTRTALLDATISCLVELGFSGTTTTEVTRRAGVSLGALLHHFPSKADLLAAAVGHVLERRQDEFRETMAGLDPGADRIDAAIDLLWSAFSGPTFTAWLELWVASRTDTELGRQMVAVDGRFHRVSDELFAEFFPELPPAALPLVFAVMEGTALSQLVPNAGGGHGVLDTFKALARPTLLASHNEVTT